MLSRFIKPTAITYIVAVFIVAYFFLTQPNNVGFSSDAVYLPALYSDLFSRGYSFFSWYLTPAPYFFPDMLVFFIIQSVVHNVFKAFIVFAIFQNFLILYLISKIAFLVTEKKASVYLTHILYLFALVFSFSGWAVEPYLVLVKSAHHVGAIINGLILICFLVMYSKSSKPSILWAIFLLNFLGVASDLLYVMQFMVPMITALLFFRFFKMEMNLSIKKFISILLISCFLGLSVRYFLGATHGQFIVVHAFGVFETYRLIYLMIKADFIARPMMGAITFIFYFLLIVKCATRVFFRKKNPFLSKAQEWTFFLSLFILFSAVFICETMSLNGNFNQRYFLNIFYFPFLFFWLLFDKLNAKFLLLILYAVSFIIVINKLFHKNDYSFNYTPEIVRCIDAHIQEYNETHQDKLKYGISTYWQTKVVTVFSQEGLVMSQYNSNLRPNLWIISSENYKNAYDFAIISKDDMLDVDLIKKINGNPSLSIKCDDHVSLLIYGKNQLELPDFGKK